MTLRYEHGVNGSALAHTTAQSLASMVRSMSKQSPPPVCSQAFQLRHPLNPAAVYRLEFKQYVFVPLPAAEKASRG
jgi:hypothetical protein